MAVYQISLKDCLESTAPPEKVLTLAVVSDTAFVYLNKVTEGGKTYAQEAVAEIAVSLASLREALELLSSDRDREDLRPLDPPDNQQGQHSARIGGQRVGWVKL